MYKSAVKTDFIAQHFLIGGDWGPENQKHSHHYQLEIQLAARVLDNHGYLVDIVKVKEWLEKLVAYYRGKTLNDLPEFNGLNPSIENLAFVSYQALFRSIGDVGVPQLKVKVWEDDIARVTYQEG